MEGIRSMKKVLLILIIFLLLIGCSNCNVNHISRTIELNLDDCVIEKENDTHGGFLGDGDYYAKISCSKSFASLSSNWKKLPLSSELLDILGIKWCYGKGCLDFL